METFTGDNTRRFMLHAMRRSTDETQQEIAAEAKAIAEEFSFDLFRDSGGCVAIARKHPTEAEVERIRDVVEDGISYDWAH